jgi:hypothetical protein
MCTLGTKTPSGRYFRRVECSFSLRVNVVRYNFEMIGKKT